MNTSVKVIIFIVVAFLLLFFGGIILGMVVKGKALMGAARIRAEVAKMNKFEAAAYIYYADEKKMPEAQDNGIISKESFMAKQLVTHQDLEEKLGFENNDEWAFFRCDNETGGSPFFYANKDGNHICVTAIYRDSEKVKPIANHLICNIEIMKDDENISKGEGRGWEEAQTEISTRYSNCENLEGSSYYSYRVF